jgi:hypothetical protein
MTKDPQSDDGTSTDAAMSASSLASLPKQLAKWLINKHWKEIVGLLISESGLVLNIRWFNLLPLPEDLRTKGNIFSCILILVAVIAVGVHFTYIQDSPSDYRPCRLLRSMMLMSIMTLLIAPGLFYLVEWLWKQPKVPSSFLYDIVEPFVFALTCASLAALVCYGLILGGELMIRFRSLQRGQDRGTNDGSPNKD